jgi:hypothetical protein
MHAYFGNTIAPRKNFPDDTYSVSREKHAFQKVKWPLVHEFGFLKCPLFVDAKIFFRTYPPITA